MSMSLRWRFMVVIWAIGAFFAVTVSLAYYTAHRDHYLEGIDAKLTTGAQMARHFIGADFHDHIIDEHSVDPAAYHAIVTYNNAASTDAGFQYLWSNLFLPDGRIVFTSATSPSKEVARGDHARFFAVHTDPGAFSEVLKHERPTYSTFHNEWGEGRMVLLPYRDTQGRLYVFGASMTLEPIEQHLLGQLSWASGLFALMFVISTMTALWLSRSLISPLRQLQRTTDAISHGNYSTPEAQGGGKEIEALNVSLSQMRDTIRSTLHEQKELEATLLKMNDELEERVRQNTAALEANYVRLSDTEFAMDTVGIGIYWVDFESARFIHVNNYAASLLGYTTEEMLDLTVSDIDPHFPADNFRSMNEHLRELKHLKFETEHLRRDGSLVPVEMTVYYRPATAGSPHKLIGFMQDITERKRVEQELRDAKQAAEAAAIAKSAFLANMSHEIRTPLNGVIGLARIGLRENAGRRTGETCARILKAGKHLQGVIDDILDFSKVEAGKLSITPNPMSPLAVTEEALALVADRATEKGIPLRFSPPGNLPKWVMGDAQRLRQILVNLLSNAIKFTESGTVTLSVTTSDEITSFAIADTGIGLSEDQCARLFRPFEQADGSTSRKFGGTGLGLAISRNLAHLMGGDITVNSILGQGSVFTLSLPLPLTQAPASDNALEDLTAGKRLAGLRLLAAEDMEINRIVLEDLLIQEGAECTLVCDGAQAVDAVRKQPAHFDLILMDVQMPIMDGREATREIKRIAPMLPIIALSAHALPEERQLSLDAGVVDYLTKPINQLELVKVVLAHARATPAIPNAELRQATPPADPPATPEPTLATTDQLPDSPELDLNAGLRSVMGHQDRYRKLLDKFASQYADQTEKIRAALQTQDLEEARRLAHGLKGVAATLGAQQVAAAALAVEQPLNTALRDKQPPDDIEPLLDALNQSIVRLLQAINPTRIA